ncbi:MAG: hypothetical protein ACJ8R9_25860 [Steroidobacteraceae bacterium]
MKIFIAIAFVILSSAVYADTEATFALPSGVSVKITEDNFDTKLFKTAGCTDTAGFCLIDGRVPSGVAFGLPKTYVKRIMVSYQGHAYPLEASDMFDAWRGRALEQNGGGIRYFGGKCYDQKNCQFRGLFSDAAGTFVAEWRIVNGLAIRTVLSGSDDIVQLFRQHIDPPEYN